MSNQLDRAAALFADKTNTRTALIAMLIKAETEVQALRLRGAGAGKPAPKVVARSNFAGAGDKYESYIAKRKVALAAFFKDNPQCRSATPDQLAFYVMQQMHS